MVGVSGSIQEAGQKGGGMELAIRRKNRTGKLKIE